MKQVKFLDILFLIFKIVLPIVMLGFLTYLSYGLIDVKLTDLANVGQDGYFSGYGLYLFASIIILLIANGGCLLVAIACLVGSYFYKGAINRGRNIKQFIFLCVAPFVNQLLFLLIAVIVGNLS